VNTVNTVNTANTSCVLNILICDRTAFLLCITCQDEHC
jgi:hypothetical protein